MGVAAHALWMSVPSEFSDFKLSWYTSATPAATLNGAGNLAVAGALAADGNAAQRCLTRASTASSETALFVFPNTMNTLKASSGVALSATSDVVATRYAQRVAFET